MKKDNTNSNTRTIVSEDENIINNAIRVGEYINEQHGYEEAIYVNEDEEYFMSIELKMSVEGDTLKSVFPISSEMVRKWQIKMFAEEGLKSINILEADNE